MSLCTVFACSCYVHQKLIVSATDKQVLQNEEEARDLEWERRRVTEARAGLVLESQLNKHKKELVKKLKEENRQLAAEQKARCVCVCVCVCAAVSKFFSLMHQHNDI